MITVNMTETEFKAYQLFLKSIDILRKADENKTAKSSLDKYLADPGNISEIEAGLEDIKAGRVTFIDPEHLWENIK